MKGKRIILTGGPCAGKSSSLTEIKKKLSEHGYTVILVPELATIIFNAIDNRHTKQVKARQKAILIGQIALEDALLAFDSTTTIFITDRGALDGKVFLSKNTWNKALKECNIANEKQLLNRYTAVIHLITSAKSNQQTYKKIGHRNETIQQAIEQDNKLIQVYKNHPQHYIIENQNKFKNKLSNTISTIESIIKTRN